MHRRGIFAIVAVTWMLCGCSDEEFIIRPQVSSSEEDEHILSAVSFPNQSTVPPVFKRNDFLDPVISMQNAGKADVDAVHVEYAVGYLYRKGESTPIQNCTGVRYNRTIGPEETISMQYRFKPLENIDLGIYTFVIQAFYINEKRETKMKTAFVESVRFMPDGKWYSSMRYILFTLILLGGILGIRFASFNDDADIKRPVHAKEKKEPASWEEIPKEHLQYIKSRQGKKN